VVKGVWVVNGAHVMLSSWSLSVYLNRKEEKNLSKKGMHRDFDSCLIVPTLI